MDAADVQVDGPILRTRKAQEADEIASDQDSVAESVFEDEDHTSDEEDVEEYGTSEDEAIPEEEEPPSKRGRRTSSIFGKGRKGLPKYKWYLNAPESRGRVSLRVYLPKVVGEAKNAEDPLAVWSLLFSDDMLNMVVENTNKHISCMQDQLSEATRNLARHGSTDLVEIKAVLGLLYWIGSKKQNHLSVKDLWVDFYGDNVCKATMSQARFTFLLSSIRFDDQTTRAERRKLHGLAPIKEVWDMFIQNCQSYYEQLLAFRGRFKGKVYKNKYYFKYY